MNKKDELLKEALALTSQERAEVIDRLVKSLDEPDEAIDKLWKQEAESRIDAYEQGKIASVSVEEAILKYKKDH